MPVNIAPVGVKLPPSITEVTPKRISLQASNAITNYDEDNTKYQYTIGNSTRLIARTTQGFDELSGFIDNSQITNARFTIGRQAG